MSDLPDRAAEEGGPASHALAGFAGDVVLLVLRDAYGGVQGVASNGSSPFTVEVAKHLGCGVEILAALPRDRAAIFSHPHFAAMTAVFAGYLPDLAW